MTSTPSRVRVSVELPVHGIAFDRVLELARAAEDAGLDGVWVPDHLVPLRPDGPFPLECWTLLAALAGATSRLRVGPLVLVLPLRDPGLLALQARTLAAVAPGRVVLGIGLGGFTYRRAAESLGIATHDLAARGGALAEALQRLRAALPADDANAPRPELWVGGRSRAALEAAARAADGWNCPFAAEIEPRLRDLDAACADVGRDPRSLARSVYALAAIAATEDEARRRAASAAAMAKLFGAVEHARVFGTPQRAAERRRALARRGRGEVALHLAGGHAERLDAIALLGRDVLPLL